MAFSTAERVQNLETKNLRLGVLLEEVTGSGYTFLAKSPPGFRTCEDWETMLTLFVNFFKAIIDTNNTYL